MNLFKKLFGGGSGSGPRTGSARPNDIKAEETSEFKELLKKSMEELQIKTAGHQAGWRLGTSKRWDLSLAQGDLIFTFEDGVIATCPAQVIGSFAPAESTWLWAWANPSIPDALKQDSSRVRHYGQEHKIARLTSAEWPGSEADGWDMAALACKLCEAQGIYRGPAGSSFVFISFGAVNLSKPSP